MRNIYLLLLFPFLFYYQNCKAQSYYSIHGKIEDYTTREPLTNCQIAIPLLNYKTLTDNKGKFRISNIPQGHYTLTITNKNYLVKNIPITVDENLNIGTIYLEEDISQVVNLITLDISDNENTESNDNNDYANAVLHSIKDPYQQAAAFNWGSSFFKQRGLDNEYGKIMINGIVMNKLYDGRPQWSNWGGLNDALRSQTYNDSSTPNNLNFGGIAGQQAMTTRASHIRKGAKVGMSFSKTNYNYRPYALYSSGLNHKGWAYTISTSYRGAKQGYWTGTNYEATSLLTSIEKRFNHEHSLNFTFIYAHNKRTKNSPITDEQKELKNYKYNAYWGLQSNDRRNARYKNTEEPILNLTHYWKLNDNNTITTSVAYQFGVIGNSRLGYTDNINPDPTNYKKMPSYYLNKIDSQYWHLTTDEFNSLPDNSNFKQETLALLQQAESNKMAFIEDGQIDWNNIYTINKANNGISKVILFEEQNKDKLITLLSNLQSQLSDKIMLHAGINLRKLHSDNYKKAVDLLGGSRYLDIDAYQTFDKQDSNLNTPSRYIKRNDKFGYHYNITANAVESFVLLEFSHNKFEFYLSQKAGYTAYQRNGKYKNAIYPTNSYGKSKSKEFSEIGYKIGGTYHLSGRHSFNSNLAIYNQAPTIKNTFANIRINNSIIQNLQNENIISIDLTYRLRTPLIQAKITSYLNNIKHSTQQNFYYADGIGITDDKGDYLTANGGAFVSEVLTGLNKRNIGVEIGFEYKLTSSIKSTLATSIRKSIYTSNPNIIITSDNVANSFDYGVAYLKNYKLPNGPQTALSLGLEYRSPKYWWISSNVNYLTNSHINISAIRRTTNYIINPITSQPFDNLTNDLLRKTLKQEKLPDVTVLNMITGKSWRLRNRKIIGCFASINNLLNQKYKTGGFEQARNANYENELANTKSGTNTFGNKYWYAYKRNYFVNFYYNF
ncbi:carboxypeptidase-like regulatory domain-containing protein [Myroides injenensis]|uniref:carboxypeptidase-like regulatory domain-containing protein n=1 Tax=Myroides injenensis TaxID=1183151 RepID=UPI00227097EC|nr:carboxypeptidase-like regulatory domain-containing protein [Myroides injenensis]